MSIVIAIHTHMAFLSRTRKHSRNLQTSESHFSPQGFFIARSGAYPFPSPSPHSCPSSSTPPAARLHAEPHEAFFSPPKKPETCFSGLLLKPRFLGFYFQKPKVWFLMQNQTFWFLFKNPKVGFQVFSSKLIF